MFTLMFTDTSQSHPLNFNLQRMFPGLWLQLKARLTGAEVHLLEMCGRLARPTAQGRKRWETRGLAPAWRRLGVSVWICLSLLFPVCPSNRGWPGGLWGVHDNTGAQTPVFWQSGRLPRQHHWQHLLAGQRRRWNPHHPHSLSSSCVNVLKHTPIVSCVPSQTRNVPWFCIEGNENSWEWCVCVLIHVFWGSGMFGQITPGNSRGSFIHLFPWKSPGWAPCWLRLQPTLLKLLLFFKNGRGHKICHFLSAYFPFGS